jgi:hypothetical protein
MIDDNQCAECGVIAPNHDPKCGSNGMDEPAVKSETCLFHGRDLRYENDQTICTCCNSPLPIDEEYAPIPDWTYEQFAALARLHANMMERANVRAEKILKRMKHRGYLVSADEYGATIEYNGACHCHPEPKEFTVPSEWLFADDWEAKVDEYMRQLEAKRQAAEAAIERRRLAEEREDYERLRRKFDTTGK